MFDTGIIIRRPTKNDLQGLAELIYRFYAFNEEFDSSFAISPNAREESKKMAENLINDPNINVFIADYDNLLSGYIKSISIENPILINSKIEVIKELYVKPQMRRTGIASLLIQKLSEEISKKGIKYIAVEFPVQNWIATDLYKKLGFRPYSTTYIKEV